MFVADKALAIYPNTYDLMDFKVSNFVRRSENITTQVNELILFNPLLILPAARRLVRQLFFHQGRIIRSFNEPRYKYCLQLLKRRNK